MNQPHENAPDDPAKHEPNSEATAAFEHHVQTIDRLMDELRGHRASNFGFDLDTDRTWAQVAKVEDVEDFLRQILVFIEG